MRCGFTTFAETKDGVACDGDFRQSSYGPMQYRLYVPYVLGLITHPLSGFMLVLIAAWNDWLGIGRWKGLIPLWRVWELW